MTKMCLVLLLSLPTLAPVFDPDVNSGGIACDPRDTRVSGRSAQPVTPRAAAAGGCAHSSDNRMIAPSLRR